MLNRYCAAAGCGYANPYTSLKPAFCGKCGNPFGAAFASATSQPAAPTQAPQQGQPQTRQSHRTYTPARGRQNRYDFAPSQPINDGYQTHEGDEYVDRGHVSDLAQSLAASISSSDFVINTEKTSINSTELLAPLYQQMQAQETKKGGRKGKKS